MTTVIEKNGYKLTFNGSATYFLTDSAGQCRIATPSLKKAKNLLNRILKVDKDK